MDVCLSFPQECSKPREGETAAQAAERRVLAISSLQALALDYDVGDHDILKDSVLLEVCCSDDALVCASYAQHVVIAVALD